MTTLEESLPGQPPLTIPGVSDQAVKQVTTAGGLLLAILFALLLSRLVRGGIAVLQRDGFVTDASALRLRRLARWLIAFGTLLAIVQLAGIFDGAWAVLSALLVTLAVGFVAVWSVLSNVICALLLLVYRPFREGDQIEIAEPNAATPISGTVVDLSLLFTSVRPESEEASVFRIPNNLFFQRVVRVKGRTS